jgi:hypothetical protein
MVRIPVVQQTERQVLEVAVVGRRDDQMAARSEHASRELGQGARRVQMLDDFHRDDDVEVPEVARLVVNPELFEARAWHRRARDPHAARRRIEADDVELLRDEAAAELAVAAASS